MIDHKKNWKKRGARVRLQSHSKLGLRLVQATAAAHDAEADRAARERLDRRIESLDGGPADLKPPDDHRGAERDPDGSEDDVEAEKQPDDPENNEDGANDEQDANRSLSHGRSVAPEGLDGVPAGDEAAQPLNNERGPYEKDWNGHGAKISLLGFDGQTGGVAPGSSPHVMASAGKTLGLSRLGVWPAPSRTRTHVGTAWVREGCPTDPL